MAASLIETLRNSIKHVYFSFFEDHFRNVYKIEQNNLVLVNSNIEDFCF